MHDRKYFHSLYVRESGGVLIELATDGPGMLIDEDSEHLGQSLFLPGGDTAAAEDLRVVLPQFAPPDEERVVYRDLPFVHRFFTPPDADGSLIVLLHGSGGNETSLMPLAHRLAPRSTLLGVRGRSTEEGVPRWFRRFEPLVFDQADIRSEAEAFAAFIDGAVEAYGLDLAGTVFLGHSNGANFLGACALLQPGRMRRLVLLRALPVLSEPPASSLEGTDVLLIAGESDPYRQGAADLAAALASRGGGVALETVAAGHDTDAADIPIMHAWL